MAPPEDENLRGSYPQRYGHASWHAWRGLALGASAEGVAYAAGPPLLRPASGAQGLPPVDAYARSLQRFAAGMREGRAKVGPWLLLLVAPCRIARRSGKRRKAARRVTFLRHWSLQ